MVVLSLVAILLVPLLLERRTDRLREVIAERISPAKGDLTELNLQLALTVAALPPSGEPPEELRERYRQAQRQTQRILARLARSSASLGPEVGEAEADLRERVAAWRQVHDDLLEEGFSDQELSRRSREMQATFELVMEASSVLRYGFDIAERTHRQEIVDLQRAAAVTTVALAVLALISAGTVFWLQHRLRVAVETLQRRNREEIAFRKVASSLSGATGVDEVLLEVSRSACTITGAGAVYVETVIEPGEEVEVVTRIGRHTPDVGVRAPYPGSLTEEVIRSGQPLVITDFAQFGPMAPYLRERCPKCEILTVPLLAEGKALGALVVVDPKASGTRFHHDTVERIAVLGAIASVALRRVRILQDETEARREAESAVRARDEVLKVVSHDLRNPLGMIKLSASWMRQSAPAQLQEELSAILLATERMERLIRDLIDAARLERGQLPVNLAPLSPSEILDEAVASHRPAAAEKNMQLHLHKPSELPRIMADRDRLLQVFGNLLGNAIKFSPPRSRVTLRAQAEEGHVEFEVADQGAGISPSDLPHIFDRHYQAPGTAHLGTGLGLAISKGIVESHGGRMWVTSSSEGARFFFTIPRR